MSSHAGNENPGSPPTGSDCERIEPLLSAFLLEEMEGVDREGERQAVSAHLEGCVGCREELALLRSAAEALSVKAPLVDGMVEGMGKREREALLEKARNSRRSLPFLRKFALAAAAVIAVGGLAVAVRTGITLLGEAERDPGDPQSLAEISAAAVEKGPPAPDGAPEVEVLLAKVTEPAKRLALVEGKTGEATRDWGREADGGFAYRRDQANRFGAIPAPPVPGESSEPGKEALQETLERKVDPLMLAFEAKALSDNEKPAATPSPQRALGVSGPSGGAGGGLDGTRARGKNSPALRNLERTFSLRAAARYGGASEAAPPLVTRSLGRDAGAAPANTQAGNSQLALAGKDGILDTVDDRVISGGTEDQPGRRLEEEFFAKVPEQAIATRGLFTVPPAAAVLSESESRDAYKVKVDDFLSRLDRRPGETPDMMFFRYWESNPFVETAVREKSTFAADVDTASYTLFRSYLYKQSVLPPPEAIRTEEFINYFKQGYPPPAEGKTFAIHAELAPSPFAHESDLKLLKIGIKGREVAREKRKACSLVFVVDTSGSMNREDRLELVKQALRLLVNELDEGDTIGIVAFDADARKILDPTPASEKTVILDAIATLLPRRNTNVAAGLELGYSMAGSRLLREGTNRVVLLSDGVANTGVVDPAAMVKNVGREREKGIFLTSVGVGMGNLNDALLEELARKGDGRCVYVDRLDEARKVFVENLTGELETIARDVKIQVEFDPQEVARYRLLGYENRALSASDFRNNAVDAGEVGAGHSVTALYELKTRPRAEGDRGEGKIATVRVRHLTVEHKEAQEIEQAVAAKDARASFAEASPRFQLAACVAECAEVLRESYWARGGSLDRVAALIEPLLPRLGDPDAVELLALVKRADPLLRERRSKEDEVKATVDAIKENRHLRSRIEDVLRTRAESERSQLEDLRRQNDALRQRLENLLSR